jgi:hypothetical protein
VAAQYKACTVFTRSNAGISGSNPAQGMDVCVRLFCVCVVLCVGKGIVKGWSPFQGVLPRMGSRNWKSGQGPTKGCRAIIIIKLLVSQWLNKLHSRTFHNTAGSYLSRRDKPYTHSFESTSISIGLLGTAHHGKMLQQVRCWRKAATPITVQLPRRVTLGPEAQILCLYSPAFAGLLYFHWSS